MWYTKPSDDAWNLVTLTHIASLEVSGSGFDAMPAGMTRSSSH
jgi:hypothetical protein